MISTQENTAAAASIAGIEARIAPLRARLTAHRLYASLKTPAHLRLFLESHVFAVWDFMSLLKALQMHLTCVSLPWVPSPFPESRRFINEIVLGEESDLYQQQGLPARAISHFELYLEAMEECGASTAAIRHAVEQAAKGSLAKVDNAPAAAMKFVESTFAFILKGSVPAMAAAFTFGREDVIPDLFRSLVRDLNHQHPGQFAKLIWYLERHIEVDGEDHGPLSLRMVADLCGTDSALWNSAATAAEAALKARLGLWDGILEQISVAKVQ